MNAIIAEAPVVAIWVVGSRVRRLWWAAAAQAATCNKRGRSGEEGGTSFRFCVCDVLSPWCCMVSAMIFSFMAMQIVKASSGSLRCFVWKKKVCFTLALLQ